jgi:tetratricopeptide (TPR) repeat protein
MARARSREALAADPENALHHLRAAELALLDGDAGAAARRLQAAVAAAAAPGSPLDSVPFPYPMDQLRVLLDEAAGAGPPAFDARARRLVAARALRRLGDLLHAAGQRGPAIQALRASVEALPHLEENTLALAARLEEAGAPLGEITALYDGFIARYPFHFDARERLGDLLAARERPGEARAVLDEAIRLLRLLRVAEETPEAPVPAPEAAACGILSRA